MLGKQIEQRAKPERGAIIGARRERLLVDTVDHDAPEKNLGVLSASVSHFLGEPL